jgi:hypothetical protein
MRKLLTRSSLLRVPAGSAADKVLIERRNSTEQVFQGDTAAGAQYSISHWGFSFGFFAELWTISPGWKQA